LELTRFLNGRYDEGVAGHITVRDPIKPGCFWVNPFGLHFKLIWPEDLLLVDHDGNVLEESGPQRLLNTAAFMIHSGTRLHSYLTLHSGSETAAFVAIHTARPDVLCAAHSHSIHGRAFASLGRELDMITQDSCAFYNVSCLSPKLLPPRGSKLSTKDHVIYKSFNGVVLAEEEGKNIAECIGNKKVRTPHHTHTSLAHADTLGLVGCNSPSTPSYLESPLISLIYAPSQNHGLLVATPAIESTVFFFMSLEKCCHVQLLADAAAAGRGGATVKIDEEDARVTFETVGSQWAGWFSGLPEFQLLERQEGKTFKFD
jgi:ribulose-5-phosphate 4-epimerase/fuculose-1-phosphate aldolase